MTAVKYMNASSVLSGLAALTVWFAVPATWADNVYIWAEETGGDVIFHHRGSIDLTGFPTVDSIRVGSGIQPNGGLFFSGDTSGGGVPVDTYDNVMPGGAEKAFGSGGVAASTSGTGDGFGFRNQLLAVPSSYLSGTLFSGSTTFADATFASLGVDPTPKSFTSTVGANTIFLFVDPADIAAAEAAAEAAARAAARADLLKKIRKLKKKSRRLKKKGRKARAKKLSKELKKLIAQLRALG